LNTATSNATYSYDAASKQWKSASVVVTDARLIVNKAGVWQSVPLPNPKATPVTVGGAPADYALFTAAGRFTFDDVRDVAVQDNKLWLATTGGIVAGQYTDKGQLAITGITAKSLCGTPAAVRTNADQVLVGYDDRTYGVALGDSCSAKQPWINTYALKFGEKTLTFDFSNGALIGKIDGSPAFQFAQTERLANLFGTGLSLDKAKLITAIDDGQQIWLVFDSNLAVLRKDSLARRGVGG
jgi:hypothetical protein